MVPRTKSQTHLSRIDDTWPSVAWELECIEIVGWSFQEPKTMSRVPFGGVDTVGTMTVLAKKLAAGGKVMPRSC